MIRTVALLGLVASASAILGFDNKPWNAGLSNKFLFFLDVPRNSTAAKGKDWTEVERPKSSHSSGFDALVLWIDPNDPTVGILLDDCGQTAGLQISISSVGLTPYYDMEEQGFREWNYINANGETDKRWAICIYFVSEDEETRNASCNETLLLRADNVVVEGINGELVAIPTDRDNIESIWKKQNCVPWMGLHYYHNMTETLSCDEPLFPWFTLYDADTKQLTGAGVAFLGKTNSTKFEDPGIFGLKVTLPHHPECLITLAKNFGIITLHLYFIDRPRLISCL